MSRFWNAAASCCISEVVRLVDKKAGDAIGDLCTAVNPAMSAGKAITKTITEGDASNLLEAIPYINAPGSVTRAGAVCTRKIPVVGGVLGTVDNVAGGINRATCAVAGSAVNQALPSFSEEPKLTGYENACAMASDAVYDQVDERRDFRDKDGDLWSYHSGTEHIGIWTWKSTVICAARGSADVVDFLYSDAEIVLISCPPERWAAFEKYVSSFFRENPQYTKKLLAGHSLGGCVALKAGKGLCKTLSKGTTIHVFNPGASVLDPLVTDLVSTSGFGHCEATIHRIKNDLVSVCCSETPGVTVKQYGQTKRGLAHGMHQFLPNGETPRKRRRTR